MDEELVLIVTNDFDGAFDNFVETGLVTDEAEVPVDKIVGRSENSTSALHTAFQRVDEVLSRYRLFVAPVKELYVLYHFFMAEFLPDPVVEI